MELYELSPTEDVSPQQPVGNLFEEMTIQEAMQLDQEEVIALYYKGYTVYMIPLRRQISQHLHYTRQIGV